MALLSYAHTGGTAFATKTDLNAADLNDNFYGTSSTTGIVGVLNPTSDAGGVEETNNIHTAAGFLPLQFREPFGRAAVYGHTLAPDIAVPVYTLTFTTPSYSNTAPAYHVLDCMTMPENGFLTRANVYMEAATGAAIEEAFPLTFRVLLNEHPAPQRSSGTRQFKSKNPGIIVLTVDSSGSTGTLGRHANNVSLQFSKGDTLYFFVEPDENAISGAAAVNLKWSLNFKFLQRAGA